MLLSAKFRRISDSCEIFEPDDDKQRQTRVTFDSFSSFWQSYSPYPLSLLC